MALIVKIHRFKVLKSRSDKFVRLEFRGIPKHSSILSGVGELIYVNQRFHWPVKNPILPGEVLTLEYMVRGKWTPSRMMGVYRLGLNKVVEDGYIGIIDTLLDNRNRVVPAYVEMEVFYIRPIIKSKMMLADSTYDREKPSTSKACTDYPTLHKARRGSDASGGRVSRQSSVGSVLHRSTHAMVHGSARGSSLSSVDRSGIDDNQELKEIGRNIARFEQTLKRQDAVIDIEPEDSKDELRAQKLKTGQHIFKRGFSHEDKMPTGTGRRRLPTFRNVKSIMRFGRNRGSISGDEHMELRNMPGPSNAPDPVIGQASVSSEETGSEAIARDEMQKKKSFRIPATGPAALKPTDFQICITIIEARQLTGLNMDPVVCVQVGDMRKYTSVKESTNCPYYNEYFVFDFHMPPLMILDKIITLSVLHSRSILRSDKLLGNFKLDVATVWSQPDRQFYHKWALLTDPDDVAAGAKGYLKCDISVIAKGDTVKVPPKSDRDEDDIEANLLLPDGVPIERQRAKFIIKIYKADGLPKMNYSLIANVKRAFTGENQDLVDPYVEVSFAGMTGCTSVKKNTYSPVWNEQIVFSEMFPPLCQRIKIQLKDNDPVHPNIIGTHFIDLKSISNDGDKGFLPTFGPAYVYLYGSPRDYSILDQYSNLNTGMGEGVSYRARVLISIRTEILENIESPLSDVEIEPTMPITDISLEKNAEFFLFGCIFDVNMIDKRLVDKPIQFELSIGNAGNSLDGPNESVRRTMDLENLDSLNPDIGYWQSVTHSAKALSNDKNYYYLPYWEQKQCMHVRSIWPDYRQRMYNSNMIASIVEKFEEGLTYAQEAVESDSGVDNTTIAALKSTLECVSNSCAVYVREMANSQAFGNTTLDQERHKMCVHEIEQIGYNTRNLKALITKNSIKDRIGTAFTYLDRLKHLCEDAQQAMPDIFIWMVSSRKRLAYCRIPARYIIFSVNRLEAGKFCGKMQTFYLKWPGNKGTAAGGWAVPAMIRVYLWLGVLQDKKHYISGLPEGFEMSWEIRNADILRTNAPNTIYYTEKHKFQMRAYIYQARSLIGSDSSGLSDPFAKVIIGNQTGTTEVIDETLSPTWDELLVFDDIVLYGSISQIKANPPPIIIEIFDQDKVGKSEFIGRTVARPAVKAFEDNYERPQFPPTLEWYEITRGDESAGELLATFELLEIPPNHDASILPELPSPKEFSGKLPIKVNKGPILPVPKGIRPTLSKYRIEVLFWGLRDLKRVHLLSVDKPRVDIECAGNIIYSTVIQNAKRNPNFTNPIKFVDVELPDQDLYRPPLTIRVVDSRSFGRITLVGTHTINSIHKYIYNPMSKREREIEERKKSLIPLQNVDLKANRIIQDVYTIEHERESCPLLVRTARNALSYGSGVKSPLRKKNIRDLGKKRKPSTDSILDNDEGSKDWWTKYFSSVESMREEEKEAKRDRADYFQAPHTSSADDKFIRVEVNSPQVNKQNMSKRHGQGPMYSPRSKMSPTYSKKNEIPNSSLTKVYPHELEAVPEYEEFKEWLHSFALYRGKNTGDEVEDDNRIIGIFKGAVKVYKWPLPKDIDDHTVMGFDPNYGFFQGVPSNDPIHVLVRVYIVKATDLHPMDLNGKADPYISLHLGSKTITDNENYVSKQLNPVFGKCFEIEATFPQDSMLTIQVLDWDLVGSDDLIGETKIDLENRFYSRHRATCGLPKKYEEQGYNKWRDAMKPTQILAKLCKDGKLDPPLYEYGRVKVGRTIFNMPMEDKDVFPTLDTTEEQMALVVLHRWQEVPRIGTRLVTEHIETRSLYNPNKLGVEQGRLEMWVEMFPMDMPLPGPALDISPRRPKSYELRVIIWNTADVVLEDDAFFTGEKMSDIYVKGWLKGPGDYQNTDIHYRSLTGEGNFNWRFIYPFDYLEAEERIVINRKESVFAWDETECKIPARLELQVWDSDHFSADDFLGAITLDLNRFPRGAKTSKHCTLDMLRNDGTVPMVNIFKQKRVRGWWPFSNKGGNDEMELTGKVEAEIQLLTREEADNAPAGLGRNEPDPLEKPNRPDASFMGFLNPLKSIRYFIWQNYKWQAVMGIAGIVFTFMLLLLLFAIPGYIVKKIIGA